ncbi:hypothetical protein ALC53_01302 [Atta colombica]|uniref:Uncharacterized protein n=1 Tax=Atta colombica TaxID=520822 RepID=A0A195BUE5_9HYME|nr:hypothetical protein ALC53_01302 [Atta colombica]
MVTQHASNEQAKLRARLSYICTRGLPLSLHSTVLCTTIRETARSARCLLRANVCRREVTREIGTTVYHAVPILFTLIYANKYVRPMGQAIAFDKLPSDYLNKKQSDSICILLMKKRSTKFYIIGIDSSGNKEEFKFFVDLHTLFYTSDMSKLRIPFTFGHLVLSSRLFQTLPASPMRNPMISSNPERRLVPGCIFTVHSDSAHNKRYKLIGWIARDVSPRLSGLAQQLEATYIPNVRRTDARLMTITWTKRGWPLSRSSLCILAVPSFSIGNLFRTYNPHN